MISRLRLYDLIHSRFPQVIGKCADDVPAVAEAANYCQERLLTCREAGDTGWYGGYAEMAFNVPTGNPYLTLPRGVARLISTNACALPIPTRNQFHEYLQFGSGNWPKVCSSIQGVCRDEPRQMLRRNTVPLMRDFDSPGYGIRFYISALGDESKRALVGCVDANGQIVTTLDDTLQVNGCYVSFLSPFADLMLPGTTTPLELSSVIAIQKDVTEAPVSVYEVNLTTGAQTLLLQMEPSETVAFYTRYYLTGLPSGCCPAPALPGYVQILAMVKLDLVPVTVDSDYLLIQSREALIAEAESMRFADMDSSNAKQQAAERHVAAVRYLQGQSAHFEGTLSPSVSFKPFGSASLRNAKIGILQ